MRTLDVVLSVLKRCKRRARIQKRHITDVLRFGFRKLEGLAIHYNQTSVNKHLNGSKKANETDAQISVQNAKMLQRFRRICYLFNLDEQKRKYFFAFSRRILQRAAQPIGDVCRNFNPLTGTIRNARLRLVHTFLKKFTSYIF